MAKQVIEKKRPDGSTIYRIDLSRRTGVYQINADSWQRKWLSELELHGVESLPSGLYTNGKGMTAAGSRLLEQFSGKYGEKLCVCISEDRDSSIHKKQKTVKVTLNHNDLRMLNSGYRSLRQERNQELRDLVETFLQKTFPEVFKGAKKKFTSYAPGTLARILSTSKVIDHLSLNDKKIIQEFIPQFVKSMDFSLRSTNNITFAKEGLGATQTIYLSKIVEEYEKKLKKNDTENTWQKLLQQHILVLLHGYAAVIEKQSVDLDGKYPDFMLVDPYGYLDIYEIKKPQTAILNHDKSRNNHYWSVEVCKAISQVENYIDMTTRHCLELADKVRKELDLQIKIVRPRGFIIAGMRAQFETEKVREDFRILNDSLKNIDIIFYDDLLENIKAMLSRFKDAVRKKAIKKVEQSRR